jgi:hypothetical protein
MSSGLSGPRTSLATGHASLVRMRWAMTYSMGSCITCAFVAPCDGESPEPRRDDYVFTGPGPAPSRTVCVGSLVSLYSAARACSVRFSVRFDFRLARAESRLPCGAPGRSGIRGARMAREMRAEKRQPRLVLESTLHILPRFTFNLGLADVQVRPEPEPERSCDRLRVSRRHDPSRSPLGLRPLVEAPWMCGEWEGWD